MAEPSLGMPPTENPPLDRLDSWKEIAAYLKRDVTTVQRWEKRERMPVHRHLHDRMGSVYASRADLDAWMRSRNPATGPENGNGATMPSPPAQLPAAKSAVRISWPLVLLFAAIVAVGGVFWLQKAEFFWRDTLTNARFQIVTDLGGMEQAAAVSRDGHFIAFLSDSDGQMDVWVTQAGSAEFHNLTHGRFPNLVNPSIRTLGFSPDGSLVTFWVRKSDSQNGDDIGIWAAPTLGGEPRPYLEGVAEFDWSPDGSQLAYHTPGPGDPLFVSDGRQRSQDRPIFTAPAGFHSHFPSWSPDGDFLYFVQGSLPDKLDIWRIRPSGGSLERITSNMGRVSHPVLLDRRTLMFLASDTDGSGPWLYSMDVERRIPHRLASGLDRYSSLAASADGRRLVVTRAGPRRTLWRVRIDSPSKDVTTPVQIPLTTNTGFAPHLALDCLLYVAATAAGDSIWKLADGAATQLWSGDGARILGGPVIAPDGRSIAFSARLHGQSLLYLMRLDGANARVVADSLDLQGAPAWAPDGQSLLTSANDRGTPHLFRVPVSGGLPAAFVRENSADPVWSPDGRFVIYSGPDIGATYTVKAVTAEGAPHPLPALTMTRGARKIAFLSGGRELVFLSGGIQHKDLWLMDLKTGALQRLTSLPPGFDVGDFDISPDGREAVLEREQERSDVVLVDIARK
jgi:Tol biopolymer transport system component